MFLKDNVDCSVKQRKMKCESCDGESNGICVTDRTENKRTAQEMGAVD